MVRRWPSRSLSLGQPLLLIVGGPSSPFPRRRSPPTGCTPAGCWLAVVLACSVRLHRLGVLVRGRPSARSSRRCGGRHAQFAQRSDRCLGRLSKAAHGSSAVLGRPPDSASSASAPPAHRDDRHRHLSRRRAALYDRGIAWMLPLARVGFYRIAEHVGFTLAGCCSAGYRDGVRRLFTWFMLTIGGVPMALLGLVTGVSPSSPTSARSPRAC